MITDVRAPQGHQQPYGTAYEQMLEKVRYEGAYPTREKADQAVRLVLAGLGRQLTGDERVDLAACLPLEAARILTTQIPGTEPLTGWAFVKDLATRSGAPGAVQERLSEQPTRRTKALPGAKYSPDEFTHVSDQPADHDTEGSRA
ncbi:DUF2267 domain-containing protein [Streptomyces sp. NPDC048663]|uniref:DUF2267 domain-containing protein n=1 Tax=Streptomyces sp. NPDC048663 TaxID=3155638 RepID=UPI0034350095